MSQREPYTKQNTGMTKEHPNGQTCQGCIHFKRCQWLLGRIEDDLVCDWEPSRFLGQEDFDKMRMQ